MKSSNGGTKHHIDGFRIGVDIGGTFTDIVCLSPDGDLYTLKVSSSVDDYARAILEGLNTLLAQIGLDVEQLAEVLHGTTVASNAILEGRGARTGLITTKGFRDTLEIGRLRMPRLYDITWQKPPVLVERYLRVEVDERVSARGEIHRPLHESSVVSALESLLSNGIEVLAVCLINSYANPVHELMVKTIVNRLAPALPVCISSEVLPEVKEYERTSTTVINAYVMLVVQQYLTTLRKGLDAMGVRAPLLIMQSNGGLMSAETAGLKPMHIIESGPAAGVVGAQVLARGPQLGNIITFDMGGTTAKAAIIEDGKVTRAPEYEVGGGIMLGARLLRGAGYLLRVPALDLAEVGAGGGSVVRVDAGGALQVGPRSAGAVPGPVCYDRGGDDPTITDANVILGYVNPMHLLAGALALNADKARDVFAQRVAKPLDMDVTEAAYGAYLVAVSNMIRAIKAVSSERGRDPRRYVLCAFGGNGPLFAASMAQTLSMKRVIIPPASGVFSALGLLCSEVEHHYTRSHRGSTRDVKPVEFNAMLEGAEDEAYAQFAADGFPREAVRLERFADLRYPGQSFELTVPVAAGRVDATSLATLEENFASEHARTYGHRAVAGAAVEFVNLRLVGTGIPQRPRVPQKIRLRRNDVSRGAQSRPVYFGRDHGFLQTPVLRRSDVGAAAAGPCIIEEYDATCVVPPGATIVLEDSGNLVMDLA